MAKAARCSLGLVTQSVVFPSCPMYGERKPCYGLKAAQQWLRKHKLKADKVDRQANTLRFRQVSPRVCRRGQFATISMGRTGIKKVLCCPK